ncbi:hypothetical protein AB0N29_19570 [Nocardioides sp. NPDC092400]|uniref:hypothetical protein n=1 Tax=Nocardioides sp. NPDC092400 TaxID=3155196 RepID=UPI003423426D
MTAQGLQTKIAQIQQEARRAINNRLAGTGHDIRKCLIDVRSEPDGTVVVHVNSGGNANAVMHALWNRHAVDSALHPDYGVLVRVA